MPPRKFRCYLVEKDAAGKVAGRIAELSLDDLPPGEVLIRVAYASLNYKDALAATGHPGVNRVFPHVPGVDAAGTVAQSGVYEWVEGDRVLVQGFSMGSNRWGGFAEYARVPQDWIVPLPDGLSLRESMMLGTAGLTAALCVDAMQKHDVRPGRTRTGSERQPSGEVPASGFSGSTDPGEVLVTGASGGVGSMAVAILAKLGYQVAAATGKPHAHEFLKSLGAATVLAREEVDDRSDRALLHQRWAGAVDTVGGNILTTLLRAMRYGGCAAACGLTAGHQLSMTVYPFILRAVTLVGIDAAQWPLAARHEMWRRLAGPWKPDRLEHMVREIELTDLPRWIGEILAGRVMGRVVVRVGGTEGAG